MPDFVPDPAGADYVYVQLADFLEGEIGAGRLPVGARLSSEDEMVQIYSVSLSTIRRALAVLRERGLVRTVPVKGTFVTERPAPGSGGGAAAAP